MSIGMIPFLSNEFGGIYQYSLTMLRALEALKANEQLQDACVIYANRANVSTIRRFGLANLAIQPLRPVPLRSRLALSLRRVMGARAYDAMRGILRQSSQRGSTGSAGPVGGRTSELGSKLDDWLRKSGADLMIFPYPADAIQGMQLPYVMSIFDLQHRLQPEFPEVSIDGEAARREDLYREAARSATMLIADSDVGKEDILNCYAEHGATADRIAVLPYLPSVALSIGVSDSECRRVRSTYGLPERFLFYPAQFWSHKNHLRIVEALGLLKREGGMTIPIALCGSHSGPLLEQTFGAVREAVDRFGLCGAFRYLGYVPDADMSALYAGAVALVMPTFFGPTNIPVLEAWSLGCPVITSDIRGIREQCGDAAILVDPRSVESIAEGIRRVWTDEALRRDLAEKGRRRLASYTFEDYCQRLLAIIETAKARVREGRLGG